MPPSAVVTLAGMPRLALNIDLSAHSAAAPEDVELIRVTDPATGRVRGRDGRNWLFDAAGQRAVLEAFAANGIDLPIDWEHATQHRAPHGQEAPAGGWIEGVDVRDGALWGRVKWTPRAAEQVANREYRFLSPVFDYEPDTGRIVRLVSAGLVNKPNLPLQALNQQEPAMKRSTLLAAAIVGALGLTEDVSDDDLATAINALKKDKDTATALNAANQPNLERFVPRGDYDAMKDRAINAEQALVTRNQADHAAAVDAAIKGALKAGKITPATADYHRAACSDTAGLERFKAFVGAAPAVGDPSGLDNKKPAGTVTALNAEQKEACRLLGISEADFTAELNRATA
ncbi:phage protease [Pseudoxanthomonas mexicana]|uniref:phage protease n=1 Tax=Pseudoxanthomonas mexicana TaxID=128785 RepID=UPI00398A8D1B